MNLKQENEELKEVLELARSQDERECCCPKTKDSFWAELDKDDVHDAIEKLQQKPLTGVSELYAKGYGEALDDTYYAATLCISAVKQHMDHWQGWLFIK